MKMRLLLTALVAVLPATAAVAQGLTVQPTPAHPTFGMIGIAYGEMLRLNVIAYPEDPCMAQLSFRNTAGIQIGPAVTINLAAGQGALPLDLNATTLGITQGQRMEVRPVVNVISPPHTVSGCLATAEVLDTKADSLVVYAASAPLAPGATPTYGLHGVAPGEVLRLNVIAFPNGPCHAELSFRTFPAVGPSPSMFVSLAPGQAASLDLNPGNLGTLPGGQRLEVQPVITLQDTVSTCTATAEVFNATTARTLALAAPPTSATQPSFGMIGLAQNDTLRLNVIAFPTSACTAQLGFRNAAGAPIGPTATVSLAPGEAALPLEFSASVFGLTAPQRMEIRPLVTVTAPTQCLATAEMMDDASGASLFEAAATAPPTGGMAPSSGIYGVASGQVLRLTITAFPEDPCRAALGFISPYTGQPIGPVPVSLALNPGQSGSLDFSSSALGLQVGQRMEAHPVIELQPSAFPSACITAVEVWDALSGRTVAWTQ